MGIGLGIWRMTCMAGWGIGTVRCKAERRARPRLLLAIACLQTQTARECVARVRRKAKEAAR